jgi:hypothetical protein
MPRRFPPPWTAERHSGRLRRRGRDRPVSRLRLWPRDADTAKVLTLDEARRIAANIAKLPSC